MRPTGVRNHGVVTSRSAQGRAAELRTVQTDDPRRRRGMQRTCHRPCVPMPPGILETVAVEPNSLSFSFSSFFRIRFYPALRLHSELAGDRGSRIRRTDGGNRAAYLPKQRERRDVADRPGPASVHSTESHPQHGLSARVGPAPARFKTRAPAGRRCTPATLPDHGVVVEYRPPPPKPPVKQKKKGGKKKGKIVDRRQQRAACALQDSLVVRASPCPPISRASHDTHPLPHHRM